MDGKKFKYFTFNSYFCIYPELTLSASLKKEHELNDLFKICFACFNATIFLPSIMIISGSIVF